MTNFDVIQMLEKELIKTRRDVQEANDRYLELDKKKNDLIESIEKMRDLNRFQGLDKNGNYKCRKCGGFASDHYGYEEYQQYRDFGCKNCKIFFCDQSEWNEHNKPYEEG